MNSFDHNSLMLLSSDYLPAIIALSILCFSVLLQSLLTAPLAFLKEEQIPGMPLNGDHKLLSFRVQRTYSKSVETLPAFSVSLIIAILIGVSSIIVNWAGVIHVLFRLAFWGVYYSGKGKVAGGSRTLCFVGGLLSNLILSGACLLHLVTTSIA